MNTIRLQATILVLGFLLPFFYSIGQEGPKEEYINKSKFRQLSVELPTPNSYRAGSGFPGHSYWQQRANYLIKVELDDENQIIKGSETITYTNNSPDDLKYLWIQLDQNMRAKDSESYTSATNSLGDKVTLKDIDRLLGYPDFDGGHKIQSVKDKDGKDIPYTIVKTMMRIDIPTALKSKEIYVFSVDWHYNINDRIRIWGRGGYEYFEEDDNYLYTIAQWFPRMAVYDDVNGWQHKQFLGNGEFALEFGDYEVHIKVPSDHIVASTGELQNPQEVLNSEQLKRLEESKTSKKPVFIVTKSEAIKTEKKKAKDTNTWIYKAENVRDFAFGSSRKYIWDAKGVKMGDRIVMAMSYYPKESFELYSKYSTEVVAHTLNVYSRYTFEYPYPKAISVEAKNGMEYPMICFNYGRPEEDGTYTDRIKYGMISVIIHEVGHNFFPMIVSSDERQWTWMDEGMNTFLQYLTEQEWDRDYPSRRGPSYKIVDYMKGDKQNISPIMINSESILQFGNNAYAKPATAFNILRETIMGRELFDYAFKTYAQQWKFKHPEPADFFRTMEDASGIDLDWFWRGWFYTTNHVDIEIEEVISMDIDTKNPEIENAKLKKQRDKTSSYISYNRNKKSLSRSIVEQNPELKDFYNTYDPLDVTEEDRENYEEYLSSIGDEEKAFIKDKKYFYEAHFKNVGGLVMPVIIELSYKDGTKEVRRYPAEIWRRNDYRISKVIITDKEVSQFRLDPYFETADVDQKNNYYPPKMFKSRFEIYKAKESKTPNAMQKANKKK